MTTRRRFLSLMGLLPAALALPPLPVPHKVKFINPTRGHPDLVWYSMMAQLPPGPAPSYLICTEHSGPEVML